MGYIAFLDPPKDSAREAIAALAAKGVQIKILTGDNEIITRKICREVKVETGDILLGQQIEQMTDQELAGVADRTTVFAKLTPHRRSALSAPCTSTGTSLGFSATASMTAPR